MKLKCINNTEENFKFFGKNETVQCDGLTLGKFYSGFLASDAYGQYTTTDFKFMIFNDNAEWVCYDPELFAPGDF